ncbi:MULTISPECIES: AraC family transcriptional regulator [unclassified Mycolicibacterium]|uniref:AraC family transcriptional regulator n=1 Tax=unclassified Mycolicibacterium TaxID=2636767 RepID=UPI001FD18813|nr:MULTISPECIES: AraC family transcriptional regulator [unclassified Mycolicibacterium]
MPFVRGTSLQGFLELVRELGEDPAPLLALSHIPIEAVGDQDSFINYRSVVTTLETAATMTATPDFGRQLALRQGLDILGPVGIAARTAATVGAAFEAIDQYMSVYSPALTATIDAQPAARHARFDWRLAVPRSIAHQQAAELALGVALRVFRLLTGPDFTPAAVHFRHEPLTSPQHYAEYFGCPVRFAQPDNGFRFPRSVLARPLAADAAVHDVVRDYLNTIAVPADSQVAEPVRLLIRRMLPTGGLTLDLVAQHLAVHPRTLQRQLETQATSFAALVDQVRREEADRYLRSTDIPLGQLAGLLGYSEQSVLSRSSQRWFGTSASAYRRSAVRDQAPVPTASASDANPPALSFAATPS